MPINSLFIFHALLRYSVSPLHYFPWFCYRICNFFLLLFKIGVKDSTSKEDPVVSNTEEEVMAGGKQKKRSLSESSEQPAPTRKMPKRSASAASKNLKEKSISKSDKSDLIETKKDQVVEEEFLAVRMTAGQEDGRPNRRITDFILHDESGAAQQLEMLEINDLFISGLILSLEASADKKKEQGVRCEGFGRIESWDISGYEEGVLQ